MAQPGYVQGTFDALLAGVGGGPPTIDTALDLRETTFVVVDLETTGGTPDGRGITEVGAVKVRGGEPLGELSTLVNPGSRIPPFVTVLTGITEAMVAPAPPIEVVLPSFLEFLGTAVLVAHNAPYDVGFLKAACAGQGYRWPSPRVLDTVALARQVLLRDEVPNHRLATLAAYFRSPHQPTHRALADARATVDVLHALIARLGSHRIFTLGEALEFARSVTPTQRRKRYLAEGLPHAPGVYVFRGRDDRPLYVGTSTDIASRVRSYFTAAEKRARISEMLAAAERVEAVECAHGLEAEVRELRLIAAHAPPYNRRSKHPDRVVWLKLTAEAYPRLSVVRRLDGAGGATTSPGTGGATTSSGAGGATTGPVYLGPFASRRTAELAAAGIYDAVPLRQCSLRLSARTTTPACVLAELGRCPAPCEHRVSVAEYEQQAATPLRTAVAGDPQVVLDGLLARIGRLSGAQRYEEAAVVRARMAAFLRATVRMQRLAALTSIAQVVAARRRRWAGLGTSRAGLGTSRAGLGAGGGDQWEIAVVRHGRLVAAGTSPPGAHPRPTLDALCATAETVRPGPGPVPCASAEETERILSWLEHPETRLVEVSAGWASPTRGAARFRDLLARAERPPSPGFAPE